MKKSKMTALIALQFWKQAFMSKTIYLLLLVICILLTFALLTGWSNYITQNDISERYQKDSYEDFVNNPDKHPHRMAHYGHFAFRQRSPLSIFDFGLERFMGNSIYLEAHVQNTTNFSDASLSTGLLRFGEISMAMVLQLLIPLFIFFIGFDVVSRDRENGTLKILFSQGVVWRTLILGNTLGLLLIVLSFLLPLLIVFMGVARFGLQMQFSTDDVWRILFIALFYLAYLWLCSLVTVSVSARSKNSKTSLVALIGIWLVFAIVLPRAVQSLGTLIYQSPSKAAFIKNLEEEIIKEGDSHNSDDPHYKQLKDSVLRANHVDSVAQLTFNYGGFQIQEGERISATIYNRHYNKLLALYMKQNALSRSIGLINPFMAIKNVSMALANTDYSSYVDFQKQAEQYRYAFVSKMNGFHMEDISNEAEESAGHSVSDHSRWGEVNPFLYHTGPVSEVFKNELLSILSLIGWLAAGMIFLSTFTKKLDVL